METVAVIILTVIASIVGTVTGFGMSTLLIPVLALFMPALETIFLVGILHFFGDLWKIGLFRNGLRPRLIALFSVGGVIASWFGAWLALRSDLPLLRVLGALLVVQALAMLLRPKLRLHPTGGTALAGGAVSGFAAGLTGIGGTVRGAFLALFDLPKAAYIATGGAIGLIVDTIRIAAFHLEGVRLSPADLAALPILIVASLVGAVLGKKLVDRIPQERFRSVVTVLLLVIGLKLLIIP
jgi:uncharacterized membrane protein YfcA